MMASSKRILAIVFFAFPYINQAQSIGLDEQINDAFMPFATWWEGFILSTVNIFGFGIPIVLILLLLGALFFTVYFVKPKLNWFQNNEEII